jgi:hypothetical protein
LAKILGEIHNSRCTTVINDASGKFAMGVNDTSGKIATGIVDTRGANLLPVSTTLVANFSTSFASVADTGGKQWELLSNCWQPKINLNKKLSIC